MKLKHSWQIFKKKNPDIKFNENPSSGRRERERELNRWTGRQTDTTKLIVAFRNFAMVPKNGNIQKEPIETRLCFHKCQIFLNSILTAGRYSNEIKHVWSNLYKILLIYSKNCKKRKGCGNLTTVTVEWFLSKTLEIFLRMCEAKCSNWSPHFFSYKPFVFFLNQTKMHIT